jgi:5-deoxy-glucuronate isomerase
MKLTDTLYRVPRQSGLHLLQRRAADGAQQLTSWRLVLEPGEHAQYHNDEEETVFVLQEGSGTLEAGEYRAPISRAGVFSDRASALYLPPRVGLTVTAKTRLEAILVSTPLAPRDGAAPVFVGPDQVRVNPRGRGMYAREVHDIFFDDPHVQRLMVGETFNPAGNWSSYPPHKHDGVDGESRLEEIYHFRIDPPQGFAYQALYTEAGEAVTHRVNDGDAVLLPYGYHPVSAPPGYRVYYLWALSGDSRRLKAYEDPRHRWIHDAPRVEIEEVAR